MKIAGWLEKNTWLETRYQDDKHEYRCSICAEFRDISGVRNRAFPKTWRL